MGKRKAGTLTAQRLLNIFRAQPEQIISMREIAAKLWPVKRPDLPDVNIRVQIVKARSMLPETEGKILSVRGQGYKFTRE